MGDSVKTPEKPARRTPVARKLTDEELRIIASCRRATEDAWRQLREAGLPRTFIRGDDIVQEYPDGTERIIGKVEPL